MSTQAADPAARQRPAYQRDASVWVAASAGTGKTTVLTNRVLTLLLGGCAPSRILCLTFTKAAAAEMANRVNDNLSRWVVMPDGKLADELRKLTGKKADADALDEARRLFARVLDAPGGMTIATIHAFCQSLLRRFPLEAGVPPHFELMDERSSNEALDAARDAVLERARSGAARELADALAEIARRSHEASFAELMRALALERGRLEAALAQGFDAFEAALRRELGLGPNDTLDSIRAAACAEGACDEAGLRAAVAAMTLSKRITDQKRGTIIAAWLEDPGLRGESFGDYLGAFFTQEGERFVRGTITKKLAEDHPAVAQALSDEADRLQRVRERCCAAELCAASLALARLAAAVLEEYARHKARRALLDYDDLVLKARDLLRRPGIAPWVLFKLDGGLDHILIDEAQDTNPEQWEIVRLIAEEFFSGQAARDVPRTIFAVGDAKQSIYSFQRADPAKFVAMRAHFEAAVTAAKATWRVVPLEVSFRSVAAVLSAVDAVFAEARAADGVALDGAPIRHSASRLGAAGCVELWPTVEAEDEENAAGWSLPVQQRQARAPRARLALAIARTIQRWIDTKERLEARDRPIRAGDVMVLVRRRDSFVTELVRALKQAKVPVAGVDRMLLTEQLAVEDMMALGQFLLLPEDDLTLACVLKGPLFGLSEDLLYALAWQRPGSLWAELLRRRNDAPEFALAATELGALLARADFVPPFELFAEVLSARRGRHATLSRLGSEAGDPLDEFLAAALAFERAHGVSLQGFLHWLAAGSAEIKRDLDQGGRDEVRVLTVHGAKGLEAPIVFLPDTMQIPQQALRTLWTGRGLPLWLVSRDAPPSAARAAHEKAVLLREQEYRRLLYVAMTRASDRLYVCGWRGKRTPPAGNWYGMVAAGMKAAGARPVAFDLAPLLGEAGWAGEAWRLETPQSAAPDAERPRPAAPASTVLLPDWCWREPPPEPSPPRPLAPSRLGGEEPAARSPLGEDRGAAFLRGRLMHRLLQSLPALAPEQREAAARRFLARPVHGLDPGAQAAILRETLQVMEHPDFAPLFGPGSAAEVPVVGLVGGRALSGQIDRLVVTEEAVLIVDFKTLRPVPRSVAEVPPAYLDQLAAYRAAIAAVYPGKAVRCALLWTDEPALMPVASSALDARR
ncbi:MAG TPA: double-strand break repair helicase AddA [Stellaceae bacterium]|nr:double-strand break repair helicase AddA [Stellaceae bacterium]